jgi:hypothetical protein
MARAHHAHNGLAAIHSHGTFHGQAQKYVSATAKKGRSQ